MRADGVGFPVGGGHDFGDGGTAMAIAFGARFLIFGSKYASTF
jgi:hypothetical protein